MYSPLSGVKVLDFSTLLPGPLATLMLSEAGAEVIKIERHGGDDMRLMEPQLNGVSVLFSTLTAGKKSVALDLKSPGSRPAMEKLIKEADVLVEQFRPGVMERLALDYQSVRTLNPRIIYCSITGYGQSGPRAAAAGHDINYQAATGVLSTLRDGPRTPPTLAADISGGTLPAVINILLALRQREKTRDGMHLDIAMADIGFTYLWSTIAEGHVSKMLPKPGEGVLLTGRSPRYEIYATSDARHVACGAVEQKFWNAFCDAIGLPESLRRDSIDPSATRAAVARILSERTAAEWSSILDAADRCATVVSSVEEALADPHFRSRGLFDYTVSAESADKIPVVALPISPRFRTSSARPRRVPVAGQHNPHLT